MEHEASQIDIIINIGLQVINIAVFFFLLIKFIGKPLTKALAEKIEQEKKLAGAEQHYQMLLKKAQDEQDVILQQTMAHKDILIQEAQLVAQQKSDKIIEDAHKKADMITQDAQQKAKRLDQELQQGFLDGIKKISAFVVQKLVHKDVALENAYVEQLVNEYNNS